VTARVGRVLGICFATCFVTGLLSHYQYQPWSWLPEPAAPAWGYRFTQGLHVTTGIAAIPLLLVKLWSVYPRLFAWPPARSAVHALERLSIGVLVASALVELVTGFLNVLAWYPWPWPFVAVHRFLAYVVVGSLLLHVAVKLPVIQEALRRPLDEQGAPAGGLTRRGLLAATGAGVTLLVATTVGQSVGRLEPIALLAPRRPKDGPQGVPVNRTAAQAGVARVPAQWSLEIRGPRPFLLGLAELEAAARDEARWPIACVEGWSVDAHWRGVRLLDVVRRAGGDAGSTVRVTSLQRHGGYRHSDIDGPHLEHALLATHLNGERLDLDHGYPVRLIAPNRAGVLNTKWLATVEVR
jgi:molybdopterin-dependent oxidoreductase-like protein protein